MTALNGKSAVKASSMKNGYWHRCGIGREILASCIACFDDTRGTGKHWMGGLCVVYCHVLCRITSNYIFMTLNIGS